MTILGSEIELHWYYASDPELLSWHWCEKLKNNPTIKVLSGKANPMKEKVNRLLFRHQDMAEDLRLHPQWNQFTLQWGLFKKSPNRPSPCSPKKKPWWQFWWGLDQVCQWLIGFLPNKWDIYFNFLQKYNSLQASFWGGILILFAKKSNFPLREADPFQNGLIFGKVPNGLWPFKVMPFCSRDPMPMPSSSSFFSFLSFLNYSLFLSSPNTNTSLPCP